MIKSGELLSDILISVQRALIGFFIGSITGILVGILTGRIKVLKQTIGQLIQLFRPIPSIAFVPLAIIWFGLGESSKYFLIFWGVFFPVWVNTHIGVTNIETRLIWAAKSLGTGDKKILYEIILPASTPFIIAGTRIGIGVAFVCLVAAEMAGAFGGIGFRIEVSHMVFRVDKMMAGIVTLGVLGATADWLFVKVINKFLPWHRLNITG